MNSNVATYNHGAGSAEANTVISQGYRISGTIYVSGQYSHDMKGVIVGVGDFDAQARQTLENIDRVLAGSNDQAIEHRRIRGVPDQPARAVQTAYPDDAGIPRRSPAGRDRHRDHGPVLPGTADRNPCRRTH